jgi:hypothetical protein
LNLVGLSDPRSTHAWNGVIPDDIFMELLPVIIGSLVALDLTASSANLDVMLQVVVPCVISLALSEEASVVVVIVVGIEGLVKS